MGTRRPTTGALLRLAPLRARNDEVLVGATAVGRRRRRRWWIVVVRLLLLALGGGVAVAVLTGAGSRGDATVLLGAVTAAGVAELLRRRLGRDEGTVHADGDEGSATPRPPADVEGDGDRRLEPADLALREASAQGELAVPFAGVWSARGAIRRDVRRVPPTRCALPPDRSADASAAADGEAVGGTGGPGERPSPASATPAVEDDLDLTREVLAALHAGPGGE
jgi:hypothetical protein